MDNNKIILFGKDEQCSGCCACMDACNKKAITMQENYEGFKFPKIDESKCVHCGICKKVCGFQNTKEANIPFSVKAATSKNNKTLIKSASGGVFAELAKYVLRNEGVVFGAAMLFKSGVPIVRHIKIDSEIDLWKLQGSKYVQSDCKGIYNEVKQELSKNKPVLFSGTPCQVASLKKFIGNADKEENLILIDIICHGVPSQKMFQDYIACEAEKISGEIFDFKFRDKNIGWGNKGSISYIDRHGKRKIKKISVQLSSYYYYFEYGKILRKNCYNCIFSQEKRVSDITIGDYWGFGEAHPNYLKSHGGIFEEEKGISCILVNTEKGKTFLSECSDAFKLCESTFDQVARVNLQLKHPSQKTNDRDKIMKLYGEYGYKAIDNDYYKKIGLKKYIYILWNALPQSIRSKIKQFL